MIHDCFIFFNEFDLLEIRLNELDPVVDRFVIVEATLTHQGKPKPLHYLENKDRFAAWHHKIVHVVVDEYPGEPGGDAFFYEIHHRNGIIKGLKGCSPDDQVMVSDVDEIPRPAMVREVARSTGVRIFRQTMYYYYLNCRNITTFGGGEYAWNGTVMLRLGDINAPIQDYRHFSIRKRGHFHPKPLNRLYWRLTLGWEALRRGWRVRFVRDGGWHFSYLGGVDKIIEKLESFSHVEYNNPTFKDRARIEAAISRGEDIFGRDFRYRFVPIDGSYPQYILAHRERFAKFIGAVSEG